MVAIKDMEMPKECYRCPLLDGEYGTCNIIGETKVDMTEERAKNCPLVEIEPLTDTEKRLFLSAVGREEDICKKIDSGKELKDLGVKELAPIVRSIERKVKKALWA